jgi:hypothetical protein
VSSPSSITPVLEDERNGSNFSGLIDDFYNLPEIKNGIDLKEKEAKEQIFSLLESNDPKIKKAFMIMQKNGRPLNFTNYIFPGHNTQLEAYLWLAEERDISEYEKISLAIALDYGAVLPISDETVKEELKSYILNLYDYFVETNAIVPWNVEEYPLEAQLALVWGADGINHPLFFEKMNQYPEGTKYSDIGIPLYYNLNWFEMFRDKKMSMEDFKWLFVEISTLREIREFLMENKEFKRLSAKNISERVDSMLSSSPDYHTDNPSAEVSYIEIERKITPGCGISNPDWQWKYFKEKGKIMGNCRDVTCMNIFFLKSLNIPAIGINVNSVSFGHHIVAFYDKNESLLRITENQQRIIERHVKVTELWTGNYFPIVWSNWHKNRYPERGYAELKTLEEGFEIRISENI